LTFTWIPDNANRVTMNAGGVTTKADLVWSNGGQFLNSGYEQIDGCVDVQDIPTSSPTFGPSKYPTVAPTTCRVVCSPTGEPYACGATIEECEQAYQAALVPEITVMEPTYTMDSCVAVSDTWLLNTVDPSRLDLPEGATVCEVDGEYAVQVDGLVYKTCVQSGSSGDACLDSMVCPDRNANPGVIGFAGNVRNALNIALTRADFMHPQCPGATCQAMDTIADSGSYWRDFLVNNAYTNISEEQANNVCIEQDNQAVVITREGRYNTCVGWSNVRDDICDSNNMLCAGSNGQGLFTYGWPAQTIRTLALAVSNADSGYLHPQCPTAVCHA